MQTTPYHQPSQDPYDDVPLGVEALVPFTQFLRVVNGAGSAPVAVIQQPRREPAS
jgi:hypothetical protein